MAGDYIQILTGNPTGDGLLRVKVYPHDGRAVGKSDDRVWIDWGSLLRYRLDRVMFTCEDSPAALLSTEAAPPQPSPPPAATPAPRFSPTPDALTALKRAIQQDGDFSSRRWSVEDCAELAAFRSLGYEWGYLGNDGVVMVTPYRDNVPPGVPFTAFQGEWLRHCA